MNDDYDRVARLYKKILAIEKKSNQPCTGGIAMCDSMEMCDSCVARNRLGDLEDLVDDYFTECHAG